MDSKRRNLYYFSVRNDLIRLIPLHAKRILEVGCAGGMTGKALREKGFKEIVGIEVNRKIAQKGKLYYDKLIIGDVEKIKLPFEKGHFDCILYGDVLEHLVDPWKVLKEHNALLKLEGVIICSIPNVRHYKIIKKLVFSGTWEYTEYGILDRTHLRFFTLDSIRKMLRETGFEIRDLIKRPSGAKWLKVLNRLLKNLIINFLVGQYTVVAVKREEAEGSV
ncbi:MAG: class I SAM-dependent methyltransferase [Deltaproteobacteria bacterium]|nr:class I SAM-dependent methyltransferase [Deltaproteobacteria bacterium]